MKNMEAKNFMEGQFAHFDKKFGLNNDYNA
jgi:hypothetical protein